MMKPILITPNHVNEMHYKSADCNLFTPTFGPVAAGYGDFGWWSGLIFSFDTRKNAYVCVAKDTALGTGCAKQPPIPENGFVLMDCGSEAKEAVVATEVGDLAYLYREGDTYTIALKAPIEGKTQELLAVSGSQLASPVPVGTAEGDRIRIDASGKVRWNAVPGAENYTATVVASIINPIGKLICGPINVTEPELQLDPNELSSDFAYTLFLTANASGKTASVCSATRMCYLSEQAMQCKLRGKTVVAFGDSLTARPGWVAMLEGYIGTPVINSGVGGDTTVNGMARFQKDVLDHNPDVVLISFGPNDQAAVIKNNYAPNIPLEVYRQNLIHFICQLQTRGTKVILITPHDPCAEDGYYVPGAYGLDYAYGNLKQNCEVMRTLAKEYGCGLIDINALCEDMDRKQIVAYGDGLHQSPEGHAFWAEQIGTYLLEKQNELIPDAPMEKVRKLTKKIAEKKWLCAGIVAGLAVAGIATALLVNNKKKKN